MVTPVLPKAKLYIVEFCGHNINQLNSNVSPDSMMLLLSSLVRSPALTVCMLQSEATHVDTPSQRTGIRRDVSVSLIWPLSAACSSGDQATKRPAVATRGTAQWEIHNSPRSLARSLTPTSRSIQVVDYFCSFLAMTATGKRRIRQGENCSEKKTASYLGITLRIKHIIRGCAVVSSWYCGNSVRA